MLRQRAQGLSEVGVIVALVAVIALGSAALLGGSISGAMSTLGAGFAGVVGPAPTPGGTILATFVGDGGTHYLSSPIYAARGSSVSWHFTWSSGTGALSTGLLCNQNSNLYAWYDSTPGATTSQTFPTSAAWCRIYAYSASGATWTVSGAYSNTARPDYVLPNGWLATNTGSFTATGAEWPLTGSFYPARGTAVTWTPDWTDGGGTLSAGMRCNEGSNLYSWWESNPGVSLSQTVPAAAARCWLYLYSASGANWTIAPGGYTYTPYSAPALPNGYTAIGPSSYGGGGVETPLMADFAPQPGTNVSWYFDWSDGSGALSTGLRCSDGSNQYTWYDGSPGATLTKTVPGGVTWCHIYVYANAAYALRGGGFKYSP